MAQTKFTYTKMNQDISKSKFSNEIYYEGKNIRILTNDSFGSITNEKGNELVLTIPSINTNPTNKPELDNIIYPIDYLKIIGHTVIDDTLVLLTEGDGVFAIFTVSEDYSINLNFLSYGLDVPSNTPLDVVGYYENQNIKKVYWADGVNELRYINIADNNILLNNNFVSTVPDVILNEPVVTGYTLGGNHTAGVIQYAYSYYNLNGSQTKISSLSNFAMLNNGNSGDDINTPVNKSPIVSITNIDQDYEFIRIYSIKYTSLNSTPLITILRDEPITSDNIEFIDDNNSNIQEITYSEFTFFGGDIIIPKHLITKDNHLFVANYGTETFDIEDSFDTRAYRYDITGETTVLNKDGEATVFTDENTDLPITHDAINPTNKADTEDLDYNKYIYNKSLELGGEGPNIRYTIKVRTANSNIGEPTMLTSGTNLAEVNDPSLFTSLKSGETYRLGIVFQNNKGQWSFPRWIGDVKMPEIGDMYTPFTEDGQVRYLYIETELKNIPTDPSVTGYKIVIVERTQVDRSVITQGFFNPVIQDNKSPTIKIMPSYFTRTFRNAPRMAHYDEDAGSATYDNDVVSPSQDRREYVLPQRYNIANDAEASLSSNFLQDGYTREILSNFGEYTINRGFQLFYSPEVIFNKSNLGIGIGAKIRHLGLARNEYTRSSRELYGADGLLLTANNVSEMNSFSTTETHPGATVLSQLSFDNPDGEEEHKNRVATYKFIASYNHYDTSDDHLYSRRRHSFVRYFNGVMFINDELTRDEEITNNVPYIAPIEGVRSFTFDGLSIDFDPNISIITDFGPDDAGYRNTTFRNYGGSALLFNIPNFVDNYSSIIPTGDTIPIAEIYRILPNQYGGDSYSARQRNRYISYSPLTPITDLITEGKYGDTYIQKFNFLKSFKSEDGKVTSTEIVSIPLETSVNLDLRFDLLKQRPDNKDADELTSYGFNHVYQQKQNTIPFISKPANFQQLNRFPTEVIPSKVKIPGELVDSFTDFLINDRKALDGKYGEITGFGEFKDQVYAFQRNAIAYLAINPRVQINASDGIPIELGTGRLIERYQYITTNSGTVNKWSIVKTKNGLMYFDLLNKSINFLADQEISTVNGLYNKVKNYSEVNYNSLLLDNPLINSGVLSYYDNNTEDIYFTFLSNESFTVNYNGLAQGFISLYDFTPQRYLSLTNKMITTNNSMMLYEHGIGKYQTYYGVYYPISVTVIGNPQPDINKIFNNILFHTEFYVDDVDQPFVTFNKIRVWNEYQDTGIVPINNSITRRKFRNWAIQIPRNQNSRDRINNQWSYIKLEFDKNIAGENELDYKIVLHDLTLGYL